MKRIRTAEIIAATFVIFLASSGLGEVVAAAAGGFTSRSVHEIAAPPSVVWWALTAEVGEWWDPDHTWSGDAANLFIEPRAGGRFGERLPGKGSVQHLEVLYADPGRLLRLTGGLGPLQSLAVLGVLSVELAEVDGGTRLTATYAVGGYASQGLAALAAPVDGVVSGQFARLKAHLAP